MATPECATCANDDCGGNDTGVPCEKFKTKTGMSYDYTDEEKKKFFNEVDKGWKEKPE